MIVLASHIQALNALFLTSCMPVFHNSIKPCFIPLAFYFSTINIKYFLQIANNKFLFKKIVKLNTKCAQTVKYYIKFIQLSINQLQFDKYNAKEKNINFFCFFLPISHFQPNLASCNFILPCQII